MSETLASPSSQQIIDHVPDFRGPQASDTSEIFQPDSIDINNGETFSFGLDNAGELLPSDALFAQTGIYGRLVAELNTSKDENAPILAVVDGRGASAYSTKDRHFLWSQPNGDRAQSFSSEVIIVQLNKSYDADGNPIYSTIPTPGKGIVGTGLNEELTIGRDSENTLMQNRGFKFDNTTSRSHLKINYDENSQTLEFTDLNSANGTTINTTQRQKNLENVANNTESIPIVKDTGYVAIGKEINITVNPEVKIGELDVKFVGKSKLGGRETYVFSTKDKNGTEREMFIYQSQSEGSWRVSQGLDTEDRDRFAKGPELSKFFQYTQDTQLHPEFEEMVESLREVAFTAPGSLPTNSGESLKMGTDEIDEKGKDFEDNIRVFQLGNAELHDELYRVKNGTLSDVFTKPQLGLSQDASPDQIHAALDSYVENLNRLLEQSGVMPDFSAEPSSVVESDHPLLGAVKKESFVQIVNGRPVEWVIGASKFGDVWIERVRLADSNSSVYGTDEEMLYSGILTMKPLEYKEQATAIPDSQKKEVNGSYVNVCGFIDSFAPIKEYRKARSLV